MKYLQKVIEYVDSLFSNHDEHFARTLYWACQLKPDADQSVQIAAYAHDTGRALTKYDKGAFLLDEEALKKHQESGALEIYNFLLRKGANVELAKKVRSLIASHEVGGNEEQNLIKDADSISYFEVNVLKHINRTDEFSKEEIGAKFDRMYNRISSKKAKNIAKPLYEKAIELLKNK